jgi:hypothetical protein
MTSAAEMIVRSTSVGSEADLAEAGRRVPDHVVRPDRSDAGVAARDHQRSRLVQAPGVGDDAGQPDQQFPGRGPAWWRRQHTHGEAHDGAAVRDQLDEFGGGVHAVLGPERDVLHAVSPAAPAAAIAPTACACAVTVSPVPVRFVDRGFQDLRVNRGWRRRPGEHGY